MKKHVFAALMSGLIVVSLSTLQAQEHSHAGHAGHSHAQHGAGEKSEKGPNGGTMQTVGSHRVETVLMEKGVMFIVFGADGKMVQAAGASGSLTLKVGENAKEYNYKLQTLKNHGIGAAIDLSKVEGHMLHMSVQLTGIGSEPMSFHAMGKLGGTVSDAMLISLQKTCPVSGQPLGSMGTPPKVMVKGKPLFVCCAGCSAKVTANAETYLTKYYGAKGKEIRPGVFEATLADAAAIAAQKKCPVMDEELGGMGAPQKVNVNGRSVYICCAGCAKKLHAEPEKYLAMLSKQGVTPPDFK